MYEADMIRRMDGLELMSLSQMRSVEKAKTVEVEKCQVHGVITEKGKCSRCLMGRLAGERKEEAAMREKVRSSWLNLDE